MSKNIPLTISDKHYTWLEEVMERRGWGKIQEAIRSVIEDAYRADQKQKRKAGEVVPIIDSDLEVIKNGERENSAQSA